MYIINPTTKITSVTPSSADANYPAANVLNDFRTNPWKASSAVESTLTLAVATGSEGIGLSYMNSATVTVLVQTAGPVTVHNQSYPINAANPNLFVNYGLLSSACTITLTFSDPGADAPYCGIIRCSSLHEFHNPQYGFQEGLQDYSISRRLNNGALFYSKKHIVRCFSGRFLATRDPDYYTFMALLREQGQAPMFWSLADDQNLGVFASCEMPMGHHGYPLDSNVSFSLLEAI